MRNVAPMQGCCACTVPRTRSLHPLRRESECELRVQGALALGRLQWREPSLILQASRAKERCWEDALNTRVNALLACGALLMVAFAGEATAQTDYPSRPIKLVVPFPPGGGIDGTARIAATALSDMLGQQVVVQNQGGAGGAIGTDQIVKADPHGDSRLFHSPAGNVGTAAARK